MQSTYCANFQNADGLRSTIFNKFPNKVDCLFLGMRLDLRQFEYGYGLTFCVLYLKKHFIYSMQF